MSDLEIVVIDYVNWRGEQSTRRVRPKHFYFGATEYHPKMQWLFEAEDVERGVDRTFALSGVKAWGGVEAREGGAP